MCALVGAESGACQQHSADSGTKDVTVLAKALPLEGSREPGLTETVAVVLPLATVPVLLPAPLLVLLPAVVVAAALVAAVEASVEVAFAAT